MHWTIVLKTFLIVLSVSTARSPKSERKKGVDGDALNEVGEAAPDDRQRGGVDRGVSPTSTRPRGAAATRSRACHQRKTTSISSIASVAHQRRRKAMADKASRALVIYGDGHANLVSPLHSHLHSFVSRASCGFLSLRDPSDAQESENTRRIREIAQLLDVYDFYTAMKGHHTEMNISKDKDDLSVPTISQRFMGLRAAIFTDCIDVGSFSSKLGFTVSQLSELIKRIHTDVDPYENFDNDATVFKLLKLLGFSGGEVLEDYDFDLVFLHITPDHKLNDEKSGKAINTDINFLNKLVGGVVNAAHPGSLVASRLHFSIVLSYGAVSGSDQSCSLNLNSFTETNSDLLLLRPRQSYAMKGGDILSDIRHHHPMLIAQWQEGVTRRDMAMRCCFDDFREQGGNLAILADRFLYEVAFKLWKAPKYGA